MDRSFLSQPDVVEASRRFVCVRLTSYEDDAETAFCRSLMVGRSGDVENTTFSILSPDGKTKLVRAGRSTRQLFNDAGDMARQLNQISAKYTAQEAEVQSLPIAIDARIGLDVAACDNQPLLVVVASEVNVRRELEAKVAKLAWSPEFIGRFVYASASSTKEIIGVPGLPDTDGCYIIEPDAFGQAGRMLQHVAIDADEKRLAETMKSAVQGFHARSKDRGSHRSAGMQQGAFWETKNPVTDPEEAAARERAKKQMEQRRKGGNQ